MDIAYQNETGFTLIEILIALTIFAVGLLAIAGLQINAIRYNAGSNIRTNTVAVAQEVMEEIIAMDGDDSDLSITSADQDWTRSALPNGYSAIWSVTTGTPVANIATVSVTVSGPAGSTLTLTNYKRTY